MELKDLAAVAGKGGLFKILKPTRSGLILEGLEDGKKLVTGPHQRVSVLSDISIYTNDVDKTVPLEDAFKVIFKEFGEDPGVDTSSDKDELFAFLKHVIPDYDEERVYASDVKKLVSWYKLLLKAAPSIFEDKKEGQAEEVEATKEGAAGADDEEK